jgi:hypothetical protein
MKILSIDVGIINLGLVYAEYKDKDNDKELVINKAQLIDLTDYNYCRCKELIHDKTSASYMKHLFMDHKEFDEADIILVERQPPGGIKDVEQLIINQYQAKSILICPRSVHAYFGIGDLCYEQRKEFTTNYAGDIINNEYERKHDIADAYCQLIYYTSNIKRIIDNSKFSKDLDQFKYIE